MTRGVYTLASGGIAAQVRLQAVAQNLANASTPGYKGERLVFELRPLSVPVRSRLDLLLARTAAQVRQADTVRDFSPGPVRESGNPLDVANTGPGFFVVNTPRGERYTRQGVFALDREGYLVTSQGHRVQNDQRGDIRVGQGEATIGEDGTVLADGRPVGRMKIVDFGPKPALVPEGGALFAAVPGTVGTPLDGAKVQLHPGAVEGANVDAVTSMIDMVEVSRGFESYVHALRRLDEVAQRSITEVGRV
jgi:flagellar basal-body rod protein FlgG